MRTGRQAHWERVYESKGEKQVGWFQESLVDRLIEKVGTSFASATIDIGSARPDHNICANARSSHAAAVSMQSGFRTLAAFAAPCERSASSVARSFFCDRCGDSVGVGGARISDRHCRPRSWRRTTRGIADGKATPGAANGDDTSSQAPEGSRLRMSSPYSRADRTLRPC
jgi:hypothetical protein